MQDVLTLAVISLVPACTTNAAFWAVETATVDNRLKPCTRTQVTGIAILLWFSPELDGQNPIEDKHFAIRHWILALIELIDDHQHNWPLLHGWVINIKRNDIKQWSILAHMTVILQKTTVMPVIDGYYIGKQKLRKTSLRNNRDGVPEHIATKLSGCWRR